MEPAPATPPVTQLDEERAAEERKRAEERRKRAEEVRKRAEDRRTLREDEYQKELQKLHDRHQKERWELADGRIQDQLWADRISRAFPDLGPGRHDLTPEQQQEDGASSSAAALRGDKENPCRVGSVSEASQHRDKEKPALLKELLPAKNEVRVEEQRLLEILDEKLLREVFDHRIEVEDPHEIKARLWKLAAKQAGLWRFVSTKKVEAKMEDVELKSAKEEIDYVDNDKLGHPKFPVCYDEIKNLLDIEKNPIFSATLKEWNRKEDLYNRRVECKKSRVASLKNEVYQLIGFFSVFQGVVLTAVSQSSFLFCHNKWSPIALSVLASAISTLAVLQKLYQINELLPNIDSEERLYEVAVQAGNQLRNPDPKGIDFFELKSKIEHITNLKPNLLKKKHLAWLLFVLIILTLVTFGVLFPVSFWSILCRPGSPPVH